MLQQEIARLRQRIAPERRYIDFAIRFTVWDRRGAVLTQVDESRVYGGLWDTWTQSLTDIWPADRVLQPLQVRIHLAQWEVMRPLIEREAQKGLLHCGRGFGKTVLGILIAFAIGVENPAQKALLVAPTYQLTEVAKEKLELKLRLHSLMHPDPCIREQKKLRRMHLLNRFRLQFASADNEVSLKAGDAMFVWLDERQDISQKKRNTVFFQMRETEDYLELQTGTPVAGSDFEEERDRFLADPNALVYNAESRANVFIPTKLFDDAARSMDRRLYEQEVLGLFRVLSGAVYWNFDAQRHVRPFPSAARDITKEFIAARTDGYEAEYIIGVDYPGYAVVLKVLAPDIVFAIDEFVREEDSRPERLIRDLKATGYWPALVVDDASGEYSQHGCEPSKAMRKAKFRVMHPKKNPNVMDRVAAVRAKLMSVDENGNDDRRTLFVTRKCPKLRRALSSQTFKNNAPDKDCGYIDDILDALGYPIYRFWRPSRMQVDQQMVAA
jgi:hypothetical protein